MGLGGGFVSLVVSNDTAHCPARMNQGVLQFSFLVGVYGVAYESRRVCVLGVLLGMPVTKIPLHAGCWLPQVNTCCPCNGWDMGGFPKNPGTP